MERATDMIVNIIINKLLLFAAAAAAEAILCDLC
jgi:hypothetical protein